MAAAQHHEISSSVSFIICYQGSVAFFWNENPRGSADVFVQQEEEKEAEEAEEEEERRKVAGSSTQDDLN